MKKLCPAFLLLVLLGTSVQAWVIESSSHVSHQLAPWRAKDGKEDTRWASLNMKKKKDSKELRPEWLQFDLGVPTLVSSVSIKWEAAYAAEYKIQISDNKKNWKNIAHVTDGKEETRVLENLDSTGRYLRIFCLRHSKHKLFSIWEVTLNSEAETALAKSLHQEAVARKKKEAADRKYMQDQLSEHGVEDIIFSMRHDGKDGHWYANFAYWSYDENKTLYGDDGGGLCNLNVKTGKLTYIIETPKGAIRDPAVHYDAEKILFSWRKEGSKVFNLYECDINPSPELRASGKHIRQITSGAFNDLEACYLPDGGIVFVSDRAKRWVNCWFSKVAVLYRCDGDPSSDDLLRTGGKNIRQLSANIEQDNSPWVLPDGRIIYQRWEYVDRSQVHYHHLWTSYPDGTGHMVYFGNLHPGEVYIDAKPIPGTDKVLFANNPGHGRKEHSGRVAIVSDRNGPDDKSMLKNITSKVDFRDPWPLSEELYIVSDAKRLLLMNDKGESVPIYALPHNQQNIQLQEPRPLIKRPREKIIPSRVDLKQETGKLILANAYLGRNMKGIKPGEIKKLLVLESLPKPINFHGGMDVLTMNGSFTLERIVGTIPVEEDGSAYMELPANRAFFFVALDENNNSIKRMQSFLSVAPGEVSSCVGCHEDRAKTPSNNQAMGRLMALKKPANKPRPIKGIPEVIDFPRDIQPILDKHCIKCHNVNDRKGQVILSGGRGPRFSHSYYMLTKKRQFADGRNKPKSNYPPRALGTSASPLMQKIDGSHNKVTLSQHEQDMIRYWIESAACYAGTYAALGTGTILGRSHKDNIKDTDVGWPTQKAFSTTVNKRCIECHKSIPHNLQAGNAEGLLSGNVAFDLTHPEKSLFLLAPLSKEQGGLGICKAKADVRGQRSEDSAVFMSRDDPGYQALLAHIAAGKKFIETEQTRFDMPNFKPRNGYIREMKIYGIIPESFDVTKDKMDYYDADRRYWESLWHKAKR